MVRCYSDESIQERGGRHWVIRIPVYVGFVPRRAAVLHALRDHVKRLHLWTVTVNDAIGRNGGITAGAALWRRTGSIELRPAIEFLGRKTGSEPVIFHGAEVMQKSAILL